MLDIGSGNRIRIASDSLHLINHSATWSPDGTRIAYSSVRTGNPGIYIRTVNRIAQDEERWEWKDASERVQDWTNDLKFLLLEERPFSTANTRLALLPTAGKDSPVPLLEVQGANVLAGRISPDDRWIAYRSDESGRSEIYISPFPKPSGKLQVSPAGGFTPRWRGDGKELYYLTPDNQLMAVELKETNGSLQVVSTKPLFQTTAIASMYDVTRDGNRFVVDSLTTDETSAPLNLVVNWTVELNKK